MLYYIHCSFAEGESRIKAARGKRWREREREAGRHHIGGRRAFGFKADPGRSRPWRSASTARRPCTSATPSSGSSRARPATGSAWTGVMRANGPRRAGCRVPRPCAGCSPTISSLTAASSPRPTRTHRRTVGDPTQCRARPSRGPRYALNGIILCARCGEPIMGETATTGASRPFDRERRMPDIESVTD